MASHGYASQVPYRTGNKYDVLFLELGTVLAGGLFFCSTRHDVPASEKNMYFECTSPFTLTTPTRKYVFSLNHFFSQELVNLLLLGRAHSNVFDGRRVIGDGDGDAMAGREGSEENDREGSERVVLTGVPERGRVGFLTLFEAYKHVEVFGWWRNVVGV